MLQQEQELLMRRQALAQQVKARRQHIKRGHKACRVAVYSTHAPSTGAAVRSTVGSEAARQRQPTSTTSTKLSHSPITSHIQSHSPQPTTIAPTQPIHATSAAARHYRPQKSTSQPTATRTMASALSGSNPPKYHGNVDPRKFLLSYKAAIASVLEGDEATLPKSLIISLGRKLVLKTPARMYPLMAADEGEIFAQLSRLPSRARLERGFSFLYPKRKRDTF
jgi:hypothetical protein